VYFESILQNKLPISQGYVLQHRDKGNHIVTSAFEHPAVTEVCKYLEKEHGFTVTYVPVDREGIIDLKAFEEAITPQTILVTVMHANNEVGTIQPIAEIGILFVHISNYLTDH